MGGGDEHGEKQILGCPCARSYPLLVVLVLVLTVTVAVTSCNFP
jgi:hypothetical protein